MKYLHFDLRALSLMRICVAFVVLLDLCVRCTDLEAFYSNTGVAPLPMLFEHGWNDFFLSIHVISGLWQVQLILFILAFFFAWMLLIGYRTSLFTVLSWFMLMSLHNRNSFILQGGDDLLRMVLFWGMFLPWGARYSCDAILSEHRAPVKPVLTVATIAYLLQICYIYTGSALLKGPEWHTDFTAMYYVYGLDQVTQPFMKTLFYYPQLLKILTAVAYYFELLVPLLFFIPFAHQSFRFIGVVAIVLFHAINNFTLFIGMFPLIGMATCMGLLPSAFMNWLDVWLSGKRAAIIARLTQLCSALQHLIRWKQPAYVYATAAERVRMALLVFLTVFVFDWNMSDLHFIESKMPSDLRFIGYSLRLDQNWGMFAPGVFKDDGWYVLEAHTEDKRTINLLDPAEDLHYQKPASIVGMFSNDRWRKYSENLIFTSHSFLRGYYCNYTRRVWNEKHPEKRITGLQVVYMSEFTQPDYHYRKPERLMLWQCGEN
jgi:hypothetical protein